MENVIPTKNPAEVLSEPVILPWMPGPYEPADAPVVVSVTEYLAEHRRTLPGTAVNALRLRMGWYAMPGAVGLWLWSLPTTKRGGSISVWDNEDSLERFINLPHHVDIMNRYRTRGKVRSAKWSMDRFEPDVILRRARNWIAEPSICAS